MKLITKVNHALDVIAKSIFVLALLALPWGGVIDGYNQGLIDGSTFALLASLTLACYLLPVGFLAGAMVLAWAKARS